MVDKKQITLLIVTVLLLLPMFNLVSAETVLLTPKTSEVPFSFSSWFEHNFGVGQFSVVGDAQTCGDNGEASYTFSTSGGDYFSSNADDYCSSGHGIWDVYVGDSWRPWREFKDTVSVQCSSTNTQCNFELYCCPHPEPSSTSSCQSWVGSNSVIKTASCVDWSNFDTNSVAKYKCTTLYGTETKIPYYQSSFKYCTPNIKASCWYYSSGSSCTNRVYSGLSECPYKYGEYILYSSKSDCESTIPVCKTLGQSCGYTSGQDCCSGLNCENFQCVSSTSASETCAQKGGTYCSDFTTCSAGGFVTSLEGPRCCLGSCVSCTENQACAIDGCPGIKTCSNGVLGNCIKTDSSCGSTINIGDDGEDINLLGTGGYDLAPVVDNEKEILGTVQIYDISYGDTVTGEKVKVLLPGEMVTVTFKVKALVDFEGYLIEAGIIPQSTAAVWEMNKSLGGFQIFNLFAIEGKSKDACCLGQPNIADNFKYVNYGFFSLKKDKVKEFSYTIQVPNKDTKDLCFDNIYWDGSQNYILYITAKNGCYKDGYRKNVFVTKPLVVNVAESTTLGYECANDFECEEGETCENLEGDGLFNFKKYCSTSSLSTNASSIYKKYSLTKEEISKSTTGDLLASACLYNSDCASRENYTSLCIPTANLVSEGVMTNTGKDDLFSSAKGVITTGLLGGGTATTACIIGFAAAGATLGTSALVGCGIGGTMLAVGAVQAVSTIEGGVDKDSLYSKELQKAIRDGDSNKVGICTAEPKAKTFDVVAFLKKIGKNVKITGDEMVDGVIILIVFLFIINIIFKSMSGGK